MAVAEGGALMMISTVWRLTTLGGRAFSQPEGLFEWDIDAFVNKLIINLLLIVVLGVYYLQQN